MAISLEPIDLLVQWPEAHCGTPIVLVQPDLSGLALTDVGYQHPADQYDRQLQVLRSSLTLAQERISPELPHSFIIALSEYALPSGHFEACESLVDRLLPDNAVCMAGLDAMSRERWCHLLDGAENGPRLLERQAEHRYDWVNAAVIWVKGNDGRLRRYFQAKIRPAERERLGDMYPGNEVLHFRAGARSFALLICFDYIAVEGKVEEDVAKQLATHLTGIDRSNSGLLFVLQANERPEHPAFVQANQTLFSTRDHRFDGVVYVNWAGKTGYSRFYFPREDWTPTARDTELDLVPEVYRRIPVSAMELTEVSLRSERAVLHTLVYTRKADLPARPGAERHLFSKTRLYGITFDGSAERIKAPVATRHELAVVQEAAHPRVLDNPVGFSNHQCEKVRERLLDAYEELVKQFSQLDLHRLHGLLQTLWQALPNPDFWSTEKEDLKWLIQVLYVLEAGGHAPQIRLEGAPRSVTALCKGFALTVMAGDEGTYPEDTWSKLHDEQLNRVSGNHVILILRHCRYSPRDNRPEAIRRKDARRAGAGLGGGPVPNYDPDFGPGEGETVIMPRLYWYDRSCLLSAVRYAKDLDDLVKCLGEVFPWKTA